MPKNPNNQPTNYILTACIRGLKFIFGFGIFHVH